MQRDRFEKWLRNIYATRDNEISCSECFDRVSRFVDLEVSGQDAAGKMPELQQHIDQCPACREEYETLRDLRRLEEQGNSPSVDDLKDQIR
jgi:hypothetical protein